MWQIRPCLQSSNERGSNLKCVPLSELFTLSELQEMEDKNPRKYLEKEERLLQARWSYWKTLSHGAHKARALRALGLSRVRYGLPSSSQLPPQPGRPEVPLAKQTLPLKPAPGLAHTPGRSGEPQEREGRGHTSS